MNKKYELTDIAHPDIPALHRIRALRDIPTSGVKKGDLGGYIEKEDNLSHEWSCWVHKEARVCEEAQVSWHAQISGSARVSGDAQIYGHARISGDAQVSGNVQVSGDAQIYGHARIYGYAQVYGNAQIYGHARIYGYAQVSGDAQIYGHARIYGHALIYGYAQVSGDAQISRDAQVYGHALISGDVWEFFPLYIQGTAHSLTTCSRTQLVIGCEVHTVDYWLENYEEIGLQNGYSDKQIKEYRGHIKSAKRWLKMMFESK
jgi:acyl-[acyl carrier protein]--UDP-N-acetylglucosamine O-acyltransferase